MHGPSRTVWIAIFGGCVLAAGGAIRLLREHRAPAPTLDCAPEQIHWVGGVARCGPGAPLPAGALLTVGGKLDLNQATLEELQLLPGIGPSLAKALVEARPFRAWDEVDEVSGIGPAKLEVLKASTEIR